MVFIYAEKASLAAAIATALNAGNRIKYNKYPQIGHYEFILNGEQAILSYGSGHLCKLARPEEYGEQYARWDLTTYPCIPNSFNIVLNQSREPKNNESLAKQVRDNNTRVKLYYDYIVDFMKKADWIINATDPDREGELIFDYIYHYANINKPYKRVWIEDLTPLKIQYAFNNLKDHSDITALQKSAEARGIADWLFGINMTVAMTAKFGNSSLISCGRVQTPTLAMVVKREKEINNFVKEPFYKVVAIFSNSEGKSFTGEYIKGNFKSQAEARNIVDNLSTTGKIISKDVKQRKVNAPLLYNSTALQATCSKIFGWELKKTENVMQKLYEAKYMSYPRTSSEHLTFEMQDEVRTTLKKIMKIPEYAQYSLSEEMWNKFSSRHFDNQKVGSHPAIIPTLYVPKQLSDIKDEDMKRLYDLLCKSLLRIVYPTVVLQDTTIITSVNNIDFKSTGSIITNPGWYSVDSMPEQGAILPNVSENEQVSVKTEIRKSETKPPSRYSEATLIQAMELAGKSIEDEEIRTLMKLQKKGLGTDATRAATVTALFSRGYITKKGKTIYPTDKGMYIIDTLPVNDFTSAELTGELEKKLHDIEIGNADFNSFIDELKLTTQNWFNIVCGFNAEKYVDKAIICPICGKKLNKGKDNIYCSAYKQGCKLSIPYVLCGKTLTENQKEMLITKGKTNLINGFTGKKGEFSAYLNLNNQGKVEFSFPKTKKKV